MIRWLRPDARISRLLSARTSARSMVARASSNYRQPRQPARQVTEEFGVRHAPPILLTHIGEVAQQRRSSCELAARDQQLALPAGGEDVPRSRSRQDADPSWSLPRPRPRRSHLCDPMDRGSACTATRRGKRPCRFRALRRYTAPPAASPDPGSPEARVRPQGSRVPERADRR